MVLREVLLRDDPKEEACLSLVRLSVLAVLVLLAACDSPPPAPTPARGAPAPSPTAAETATEARGLRVAKRGATPGYVLYSPLLSDKTYLIDDDGQVVHMWASDRAPGGAVYLLDNGHLLRTEREPDVAVFKGGGQSGRIREYTWDGELVWDYLFATEEHLTHHDIEPLPNGNVLAIAWEAKTVEDARRAGRQPDRIPATGMWPDMVIELEPQPPNGGRIVWEWHTWDHLVQNVDPSLPNYGDPATSLGRIDINGDRRPQETDEKELARLRALGYVEDDAEPERLRSDFMHTNAVHYNPELDQIALSSPRFNEIWIIDHSTTTVEAAGSSGGRSGRGGDLLYRWGNPHAYGRGRSSPQRLFGQHDVRWIPRGLPGAGHLLIFNNDLGTEKAGYSAVVEIAPPMERLGFVPDPRGGRVRTGRARLVLRGSRPRLVQERLHLRLAAHAERQHADRCRRSGPLLRGHDEGRDRLGVLDSLLGRGAHGGRIDAAPGRRARAARGLPRHEDPARPSCSRRPDAATAESAAAGGDRAVPAEGGEGGEAAAADDRRRLSRVSA